MIEFNILKRSTKSRARLGILKTPHGEVETPSLVPVATRASVRTLTSEQAAEAGCQLLICNAFHLHLRPGENIVNGAGGLHKFMNWKRPLMTDSGGFQVFSWGFGQDLGMEKMFGIERREGATVVEEKHQPKTLRITEDGVHFRSGIDGSEIYLDPKTSIGIQEKLGADIMFAFDECTPPTADRAYTARSMEKTHRWAKRSLEARTTEQALFGIVQGGYYEDLRSESARVIGSMPFDGFGIGGDLGGSQETTEHVIGWSVPHLPEEKPRHLLGIGHPENIAGIIAGGVDLFDCMAPTHYARHGIAFTSVGRINMAKAEHASDLSPLDPACSCPICQNYSRSYISHLFRARELTSFELLTLHNLYYMNALVAAMRQQIKDGTL